MSKSLLLLCQSSPWSGLSARETLDVALAGGAFDLPISMLWLGDGVWQLAAGQQPELLAQKNLQAQLSSLPLFGVEQLFVCAESLAERSLQPDELALPVTALDSQQIKQLIQQADQVLNFS